MTTSVKSLYSPVLRLSDIQRVVPAGADGLKDRLRDVRDRLEAIAPDVHRLSRKLHPSTLHVGLVAALNRLCGEFSEQAGMTVEFIGDPISDEGIEEDLALAVFRVTQEALANAAKHSGSQHARVSLTARDGALHLAVADQGAGFDLERAAAHGGLGLTSIRERAWLIGAKLRIQSAPSQGTQIDLVVPLHSARNPE